MKICVMAVVMNVMVVSVISPVYGASKTCDDNGDKSCRVSSDFYVTGALGAVSSNRNQADFQQSSNQGIGASKVSVDDNGQSFTFGVGYQLSPMWAIEGGYVDLGQRGVSLSNTTLNPNEFPSLVENIFPESGSGYQLGVMGSFPMTDRFGFAAKLGFFDVEQTYQILLNQKVASDVTRNTAGITYGGEIQYRLSDNSQLYLSLSRYQMDRDVNDMVTFGFRHHFNRPNTRTVQSISKPKVTELGIADMDNDGVANDIDNCLDSDSKYKVDDYGCTLTTELEQENIFIIHFDHNSDVVTGEYQSELEQVLRVLNKHNVSSFSLFGHASSLGTEAYNQSLSEARARAVGGKLRDNLGVIANIESKGMGETKLLDPADTAFAHALNRRVEIVINTVIKLPITK